MAKNLFSILTTECIYRHKPETFKKVNEMIDCYIPFYNHERIRLKTGYAHAEPLRLKFSIFLPDFLCCPYNLGLYKFRMFYLYGTSSSSIILYNEMGGDEATVKWINIMLQSLNENELRMIEGIIRTIKEDRKTEKV